MIYLPISIVIPCSDDMLIRNCLESIDCNLEIIVSLNSPSTEVRRILEAFPAVKVTETSQKGIALAYNQGIEASSNKWVLLMDSDCIFEKDSISKMWAMTNRFRVIKGRVVFKSVNITSSVISRVRDFTTSDTVNAYSPPLLFNKDIIDDIGYYFHPVLIWSEDSDFNYRVKINGISIGYVHDAVIFHPPLSIPRDLQSAFRYGIGRQIGKDFGIYKPHTIRSIIGNFLVVFKNAIAIFNRKGILPAIYYFFFWNPAFRLGTFFQRWLKIY